ncbi:MAG TPA: hypothetical protein VGZ27_19175 [Vicinamibacterales bacterium]|nr:hypothetical protein [Vicinamibacterales bacterium]
MLFAALAIAARLPFLLSHKIAFDSDEAVEGLMARHVLRGELPAFFWGQAFKGVPEVYAAAGAFAIFGPSVTVVKSVTLALFAAYVALNYVLLDSIAGRWLAAAASLLLILAPPALVFWSLDASAEYILLMLLGTILLLLCLRVNAATLVASGMVIGLGLWIQQIFAFYLIPVAIIVLFAQQRPRGLLFDRFSFKTGARPVVALTLALAGIAAVYLALGAIAFVTGGFSIHAGPVTLGAHAPQKMFRGGAVIAALALTSHVWNVAPRGAVRRFGGRHWPLAAGFLIGYAPAIVYSILVEPARSPARNANLRQLLNASPDIFGNVVPIVSGFKIATTQRLPIPWIAVVPGALALTAYTWSNRHRLAGFARLRPTTSTIPDDFFPLFFVLVPALFLASGAYLDTQSYRYLIPWYAGLCVAWAAGCAWLARGRQAVASLLVGIVLAVHAWQQLTWYRSLTPDVQSTATIDCLRREGIRGGYADYWTSYKLTFLSNEEIIVAPADGVDRYPAYTAFVRSLPADARTGDLRQCLK